MILFIFSFFQYDLSCVLAVWEKRERRWEQRPPTSIHPTFPVECLFQLLSLNSEFLVPNKNRASWRTKDIDTSRKRFDAISCSALIMSELHKKHDRQASDRTPIDQQREAYGKGC